MDLFIERNELARGLARVQGIVERRSTSPMLSHVLLHAHEGGLRMTATDTEVAFIGELAANVEGQGELAVDAGSLFQVVRKLPEPTVHLKAVAGQRLEITSGRSLSKLPGVAAEEFPPLPAFDAKGTATIASGELKRMVEQTSFAVATDDARYGLNGVHVEPLEGSMVRFVATDGHRLSAAQAAYQGELAISPRMLVPRKALAVLRKLLDGGDEPRVATALAILHGAKALPAVFPDLPKEALERRGEALASANWASASVRAAIEAIEAAMVAIMVVTMIVPMTSSGS